MEPHSRDRAIKTLLVGFIWQTGVHRAVTVWIAVTSMAKTGKEEDRCHAPPLYSNRSTV